MDRSARQARLDRRRGEQRRGTLKWLVYIVIAAVIVAGLLIYAGRVRTPQPRNYTQQSGNVLGDPNAPVTFVEFGDFQCPVCLNTYLNVEEQLINEYVYTGKMSFTFQAVGFLDRGTTESSHSAEAAYCAGDQNKFWEYHGVLYANQGAENSGAFSDNRLIAFAETINLDMDAFRSCFLSGQKAAMVDQAEAAGFAIGVDATPSFVINGVMLRGYRDFAELQAQIEAALAAAGAN